MNLFLSYATQNPAYYFSWVVAVMFSICLHEYAHAAAALRLGDDTAARQGHLTLNPLVQMGLPSIVMLLVIGIAWGAVPVNPGRIRRRGGGALVAVAGPLTNLFLCIGFGLMTVLWSLLAQGVQAEGAAMRFLWLASVANGVLFVFNMLPVPMFDGWSVFALLIPRMGRIQPQQARVISLIFLALAVATPAFGLVWQGGTLVAELTMHGWLRLLSGLWPQG